MDFTALAQRVLDLLDQRDVVQRMKEDERIRTALGIFFAFPTRDQLAAVLREAFHATLLADEGRATRFVLSLLPDRPLEQAASGELVLASPLPVTRANIRRLAPTAPPQRALLRLRIADGGTDIVSVMTFAEHYGRPVTLSIAGHRPGVLSVSFNNQKVLHLQGDEVTAVDGTTQLVDADDACNRLALHQQAGGHQVQSIVAELVWQAVRKLKRAGHGGAFWFLPAARAHQFEGEFQRIAGVGDLFVPIGHTLQRVRSNRNDVFPDARHLAAENLHRWADDDCIAATLAQFAATDGAVLLSLVPALIGFGAFVHTHPPAQVRRHRRGETATIEAHALGGGRHRSAAAFCGGGQPGERAAVVVSQDGTVTMFFNVSNEDPAGLAPLGAVPPCVLAVQVEQVGRGFAADE